MAEEKDKSDIAENVSFPRKQSAAWVAMKKVKTTLSLTNKGATPVNWKCVFLVFISLFSSSFNITFLFPFLPEMILMFGFKEEEKGYYAGIVASALFLGRFVGCYFWGWLSDKKGRKPIILITVILNGVSSLAFGFTTTLWFAFVTRFISGLVNGTVGTAKTILYEISDNTNQAVGMSIISVAWGSGIIVGPAVGGYLANPCKSYPDVFPSEGFFYKFPYFIPGFAAFIICLIPFLLDVFLLPETLNLKKQEIEIESDPEDVHDKTSLHSLPHHSPCLSPVPRILRGDTPRMTCSVENLHVESEGATFLAGSRKELHITRHGLSITDVRDDKHPESHVKHHHDNKDFYISDIDDTEMQKMLPKDLDRQISVQSAPAIVLEDSNGAVQTDNGNVDVRKVDQTCFKKFLNYPVIQMMRQFEVIVAVSLYSLFSFSVIGVEEIFTVWAATDVLLDGLGFEPNEIGAALGASSFPLLFLQLFVFPNLCRRLGIKKTLLVCTLILLAVTQAMPCLHLLSSNPVSLWTLLILLSCVQKLMVSCVFSCTGLLINNSVQPHLAGTVNGLAMTVTAMTRSIAPLFGGSVYTWIVSYASQNIGPPFDISFVFFLFGLIYFIVCLVGVTIPNSLNEQKK
ncbi:uncharacterized protein LOC128232950 [Mya arenaria]|uniref:uncharacterized protein LOC128232950 n=1 Tax=Mya arenaria TaxID=6604 RepID=UPI0022E11693|nr:uncharacterized protein LOC128232950 [Mya arenaria]XP_052802720.1 uncharacterized protein LOC128232950 [Mya arenaria]